MNRRPRAFARARARARARDHVRDHARDRAIDHAITIAITIACDLDRARDHARDHLDPTLALARASNLDHAHARALALALARDRDRAIDLARDDLAHNPDLDLDLARNLTRNLDLARNLTRDLALARDLAHDLAHASNLTHARDLALALDRAHNCAFKLIRAFDRARDLHVAARQGAATGAGSSIPGRVPRGVVALATRMLPVRERPRYREEFRDELVELPRQERLGYALRVLVHAWELRRVLTGVVRTPDGAPARRAER